MNRYQLVSNTKSKDTAKAIVSFLSHANLDRTMTTSNEIQAFRLNLFIAVFIVVFILGSVAFYFTTLISTWIKQLIVVTLSIV